MNNNVIYLDNAATSWPKPPEVLQAMKYFMEEVGSNPGRSGHRLSVEAGRILYNTREYLAELFNVKDPLRIVFSSNVTEALNLALRGFLKPGNHVITSSLEHNSVMRPLRELEKSGVEVTVIPCLPDGSMVISDIESAIQANTVMIVLNHASNVVGSLLPVPEAGKIARKHGIYLLVDAAQTAGSYPIDIENDSIDLLAFTGHKSLYGPQGTGGLAFGNRIKIEEFIPLKAGGTGSKSEYEIQPDFLPDIFESGTPNTVGIAGLGAGIRFILNEGVDTIRKKETEMIKMLIDGLENIKDITVYGNRVPEKQMPVVSFAITDMLPSETGLMLDENYGIMCRVGLHCSPAAHKTIGTFPGGTVRFSTGFFNTAEEIEKSVQALSEIVQRR